MHVHGMFAAAQDERVDHRHDQQRHHTYIAGNDQHIDQYTIAVAYPGAHLIVYQLKIKGGDDGGYDPGYGTGTQVNGKFTHSFPVAYKMNKWDNSKGKLHAEQYLAEDQQLSH